MRINFNWEKTQAGKIVQFILALSLYIAFFSFILYRVASNNFNLSVFFTHKNLLLTGFKNTLIISGISLVLGLILGFILYMARESKVYLIKSISNIFIETMMGTPLLVLVFVTSFFIGPAFHFNDDYILGILALTGYIGPYMANVFKSVIDGIDKEQYIIMDLYGFTFFQRYRYIILPQIVKLMMPPLMNNLSYLIKGSALLQITAVTELFYSIKLIQSKTFAFTEGYVLLWIAYLIITIPISLFTKYIEKRFTL